MVLEVAEFNMKCSVIKERYRFKFLPSQINAFYKNNKNIKTSFFYITITKTEKYLFATLR